MPLKTILVEDEPLSKAFLSNVLKEFFPEVEIIANEATVAGAVAAIAQLRPDLVFLDIELQTGTGFEVLQQTAAIPFKVIFTTALDHLAINMIRICGVDYLQKPIDVTGLKEVLGLVLQRDPIQTRMALDHLMQALANHNRPTHLLLTTPEENRYVAIADIICIEAVETRTRFLLKSGDSISGTQSLRTYEALLGDHLFFRTHQHFLVNTGEIREQVQQPECLLIMSDGTRLPLSPKKIEALNRILDNA